MRYPCGEPFDGRIVPDHQDGPRRPAGSPYPCQEAGLFRIVELRHDEFAGPMFERTYDQHHGLDCTAGIGNHRQVRRDPPSRQLFAQLFRICAAPRGQTTVPVPLRLFGRRRFGVSQE